MMVLYILIVIFSLSVGLVYSNNLKKREIFFGNLLDFLNMYESNLMFKQDEFLELLNSIKTERNKSLIDFINLILVNHGELKYIPDCITKQEAKELKDMICSLSTEGLISSSQLVQHSKLKALKNFECANKKRIQYSTMSIKLSILIGLLIVILLL